jgi:thiamine-phosphate pyrophosphorylase
VTRRGGCDLSVYLVVGPDDVVGRAMIDLVLEAVAGGVTAVQLRQKNAGDRAFVEQARAVVSALEPSGVPLIVNDRVDVAIVAGAHGVHVGQDDMPAADARRLMGNDAVVGLSITNVTEARALDPSVVDYAGVGPVFETPTKPDAASPLGIEGTRDVSRVLLERNVPTVAIGGISLTNAGEVLSAGVHGLAVVSAICAAADPRIAAASLLDVVRGARRVAPQ